MICVRCGKDCKYPERSGRTCPHCKGRFAFEPREGDPLSDTGFRNAIDRVSAEGKVKFTDLHLFYELARMLNKKRTGWWPIFIPAFGIPSCVSCTSGNIGLALVLLSIGALVSIVTARLTRPKELGFERAQFDDLLKRWRATHGEPQGLIVRRELPPRADRPEVLRELAEYSFDRAVICDRRPTVDMLLANRFHFENNCAVLSDDGYPEAVFDTVRAMLAKNPKLMVYALHDASVCGCLMPTRLAQDPSWFLGRGRVVDVGLRPSHARTFRGLWKVSDGDETKLGDLLPTADVEWLGKWKLELAALRPEKVIKQLFRAMSAVPDGDGGGSDGGAVIFFGDGDGGGDGGDGPADSFG
jgi:DNA-directed RNA polymerase subunit RPC12/RpoP